MTKKNFGDGGGEKIMDPARVDPAMQTPQVNALFTTKSCPLGF